MINSVISIDSDLLGAPGNTLDTESATLLIASDGSIIFKPCVGGQGTSGNLTPQANTLTNVLGHILHCHIQLYIPLAI